MRKASAACWLPVGCLLVAGKELGSDSGNGHDFGGAEFGLGIVFVSERFEQFFEQFIEEAVRGYNRFRHGRLREEIGFSTLTLPKACTTYTTAYTR